MAQDSISQIPVTVIEGNFSGKSMDLPIRNKIPRSNENTASAEGAQSTSQNENELKDQLLIKFPWGARLVFLLLLVTFIIIGATYFWAINAENIPRWLAPVMTLMWGAAGTGTLLVFYWMWRQFSRFSNDLSVWTSQLLEGDFSSRMPIRTEHCPSKTIRDQINKIAEDYEGLSNFQQQRLTRQSKRIERKKYYLEVLYDVASSINKSNNLEDLLQRFLHTLTTVVKAKAATVRLLDGSGDMRLVASIGLSDEIIKQEETLPMPDCLCGEALKNTDVLVNTEVNNCSILLGNNFFESDDDIQMLAIPLQYRGKTLGVYNLFVHRKEYDVLESEYELLVSIGQHLGMAIEQSGVEEDARTLSIIEERTRMAHELHDSLAQTLASLRFKVRLFDDSLLQGKEEVIWHELEGLENTIDDAYAELRSLITDFRAPIDGKGVVRAVKRLTERFKIENDIDVFFYHNWDLNDLSRDTELEVVRIVQEALVNIKKHAKADNVRILMSSDEQGHCSVLIEDDGIGLPKKRPKPDNNTGEHIGLSVMTERAARINGELHFDSDGEGTLVQLNFDAFNENADDNPVTLNTFKNL
jgi:two-component system nitrate/nitrite sensor histidine kinase NarX